MSDHTTSTKKCTQCGEQKPLGEFSRDRKSADGLDWRCKACKAERMRAWRAANRARIVEYKRTYRVANRERRAEYNRAWKEANPKKRMAADSRARAKYPERRAARLAVKTAVQRGKMAPARDLTCTACGAPAEQYHHHNGYDKEHRLDVIAVCITCHVEAHRVEL